MSAQNMSFQTVKAGGQKFYVFMVPVESFTLPHLENKEVLSRDWRKYLIGTRYNTEKGTRGGKRLPKGQNDPAKNRARTLAAEYGEDPKTIGRFGVYAESVDTILKKSGVDVRDKGFTFDQVVKMAKRTK